MQFRWLTPDDMQLQEELETACKAFYAGTEQESNVAYLPRAEKMKLVRGVTGGIGGLWDGDSLLAQVAVQSCELAENVTTRFVTLGSVQDGDCYMFRNGLVHPEYLSQRLMSTLLDELFQRLDGESLPVALTTKRTNTPVMSIGRQFGFTEVCDIVRRDDNERMVLLLRQPRAIKAAEVA